MKNLFVSAILLLSGLTYPQSKDPDLILKKVIESFSKVKDYVVDVQVKVDVDFIKVPDTKAKIYFKQPDKLNFESDEFAMLPKEGINFSPLSFLKKDYTALYQKEDYIESHLVSIIKVIPSSEQGDIVLTTLWVDQSHNIIRKVESTTKTNGTFTIDLNYDEDKKDYYLPNSMVFGFNIDKMNLPKAFTGQEETESRKNIGKTASGKVYITYSNYKVNKGLSDKIFEKKKK
jgi:outer membrane lipoprotein-sorting protein